MGAFTPFVRKLQHAIGFAAVPVTREYGDEPLAGVPGIPDPVRDSAFDGIGHRKAQLFSTFAPFAGFGTGMGSEDFFGREYQPEPAAESPRGKLGISPQRRVLVRPPTRGSG